MVQKLNFFVAAFLSTMGLSLVSEIFMEDDFVDKIDDFVFLLVGLFAVYWYRKNAAKKSMMPIYLMLAALATKIGAIMVEIGDKEAVGDDFGIFTGLVIALVVVVYQHKKIKKSSA